MNELENDAKNINMLGILKKTNYFFDIVMTINNQLIMISSFSAKFRLTTIFLRLSQKQWIHQFKTVYLITVPIYSY